MFSRNKGPQTWFEELEILYSRVGDFLESR